MARVRTGTLEGDKIPLRDAAGRRYWRGKVRLLDGSRARVDVPEPKCYSRTAARDHVRFCQEDEDKTHAIYNGRIAGAQKRERTIARAAGETCDRWYERFQEYRRAEVGSVDDDGWRWAKWIAPHIGTKPIASVTPDDVENIRDALTAAVIAFQAAGNVTGEGRLAPKTAQNVWAALTTPFKYASTRKGPRELRVREEQGNPCLGIPPPRDGSSKQRHWCRPGEILAVVSCTDVPLAWREAIAVGAYLHLRPGELHELRVKDLDLDTGEVRISRAYDEREKVVKAPKTEEGIRHVSIPPALLPLLARMARDLKPENLIAPVVAATPEKSRASLFRGFLKMAGVERAELFVETATHLMIDFRSLRDSGITWRFLAGERGEVVQREAGHEHIATTLGYAKEVHSRGGRFGEPFPPLPFEIIDPNGPPNGPPDVTKRKAAHLDVARANSERRAVTSFPVESHTRPFSNPASPTRGHADLEERWANRWPNGAPDGSVHSAPPDARSRRAEVPEPVLHFDHLIGNSTNAASAEARADAVRSLLSAGLAAHWSHRRSSCPARWTAPSRHPGAT